VPIEVGPLSSTNKNGTRRSRFSAKMGTPRFAHPKSSGFRGVYCVTEILNRRFQDRDNRLHGFPIVFVTL
jgi:hypothetical protein